MTTEHYSYDGKLWRTCATASDENSFFHAACGNRTDTDEGEVYFDKQATFRRMRWSTFLSYFETESMPDPLIDILVTCFSAKDKYKHSSVKDKDDFRSYVLDIIMAGQCVVKEEIPILATLENIEILLLSNEEPCTAVTVKPNRKILGNYKIVFEKRKNIVLCLQGDKFLRLELVGEDCALKSEMTETKTAKEHIQLPSSCILKYQKGGRAGSESIEYQVRLLTVLVLNSLRKLQGWKVSTESKKAGKLDDVVVEWQEGAFLIQAEHKKNKEKKITLDELLSTNTKNDEFSLSKYFLSYQEIKHEFKGDNTVAICTNRDVQAEVLEFLESQQLCSESLLYYGNKDAHSFNKFSLKILPHLKQSAKEYFKKNYKNKNFEETIISDENLKDFLGRLKFYSNYPLSEDIIQKFVSSFNWSGTIRNPISFAEIYAKIMKWFQLKTGIYLTETIVNAMLLEINSDQYWQKLEKYKISFKESLLNLQHRKKCYYINADEGYLLQELQIYQALKNTKSKILYANSYNGMEWQKNIIEAFQVPFYTILIICWPKGTEEIVIGKMCDKLRQILEQYEDKTVILVAESNDNLLQQIGVDRSVCDVVNGSVSFKDFSQTSQNMLLKQNIIFQGTEISLQELLETRNNHDWIIKLSSEILEKLVRKEQIVVGQKIRPLQEQIDGYYIDRIFKRGIKRDDDNMVGKKEIISETKICDVKDKVVLIADAAGMGKSTVLSHLEFMIKNKNPHLWVIRIELSDYTGILSKFKENNKFIDIMELLDFKYKTKLSNQLEKVIFSMDRKVVILIDGVDEVSPDYTELVERLLVQCQRGSNFAKVLITTRPNKTQELATKLQLEPYTLLPFTEPDQLCFLTNYWMHNLKLDDTCRKKCEEYAFLLIRITSSWTTGRQEGENHFAGIPLLVRMLAEIFQSNDDSKELTDWEGCYEYVLKGNGIMPKLPEKCKMNKVYHMFIEKKRSVFRSKGSPSGNTTANKALDDQFNQYLAYHRVLALEEILCKSECELFQHYQQANRNVETEILEMGIVQKSENSFHFAHRTFAEYFVAESLIEELQLQVQDKNQNFQKFFFDQILLKAKFKVVRAFFNTFLEEIVDRLPSNIFESYRSLEYNIDFKANYHLIHNMAREGCTAILRLLFKCIDFKVVADKEINYYDYFNTSTPRDILSNTLLTLDSLVQNGGLNIGDEMADTPLIHATKENHLEMVKFLVKQGANLNSVKSLNKPLWVAIFHCQFDMVKFMIQHGADLKAKNNNESMLYTAISTDCINIIELLLENTLQCYKWNEMGSIIPYTFAYLGRLNSLADLFKEGLNVNSTVENQETLIFGAARGGQLTTIEYLVNKGANINAKNERGNTMLHLTVTRPSLISTARLLIQLGIKMNVKTSNGNSALHLAINNLDMVKLLVESGASVNERDRQGKTALHTAVDAGMLETVKYLAAHGSDFHTRNNSGETILHSAAQNGQLDTVKYLVTRLRTDVNATDNYGSTPLHSASLCFVYSAAVTRQLDTIKFLVDWGADFNIRNNNGSSVLHTAALCGQRDIIEYFKEVGADVDIGDNNNRTALHIAALRGELDIVKCLVGLAANVDLKDNKGCTALHLSALYDKRDIVEFLWKRDIHNNATNEDQMTLPVYTKTTSVKYVLGKTSLHFAAEGGDLDAIKFFAELGVDLDITDDDGATPLHYAAMAGRLEVAKFLVQLGSNVHNKTKEGFTPSYWAARRGHRELVKFFLENIRQLSTASVPEPTEILNKKQFAI